MSSLEQREPLPERSSVDEKDRPRLHHLPGSRFSARLKRSFTSTTFEGYPSTRRSTDTNDEPRQGLEDLNMIDTSDGSTLNPPRPRVPTRDDSEPSLPTLFPSSHRWRTYFMQEVAHNHFLEAQLLLLSLATGIIDAVSITSFRVFVSKQTGNTVFMALYSVDHPYIAGIETNIGVTVTTFLLGAAFLGHLGNIVNQRRRIWLLMNNLVQSALIYAAAAIMEWVPSAQDMTGPIPLLCISLLSFSCGGQIALAVCVKMPEVNTTMITGAIIQLATDRHIFHLRNVARNRRVLFFAALLAGTFVGATTTRYVGAPTAVLLMAVTKTVVFLSFFLNHGMVDAAPAGKGDAEDAKGSDKSDAFAKPLTKILWGD